MRKYKYKLIQDGMVVATVEASTDEQAKRDINHYALMYSQDGPVKIVPSLTTNKKEGE